MNEELLKRKERIIEELPKYFPENADRYADVLNGITDETQLERELNNLESIISDIKSKNKNVPYSTDEGETYYADVVEDENIYDSENEEDQKIIEDELNDATKDYLDINPTELHDKKDYGNLINVDVVYDEQIGYRVIENENGLFHGIQKESSWFVYPSEKLNLNIPENVEICNALFKTSNGKPFILGSEIELDGVNPAEIFMPFVAMVDDPLNKLTYADVLIGEGITVDENFENDKVIKKTVPGVTNKVTKGFVNVKFKDQTFGFKEDLILEPVKYIEGTFIPYPREQKPDETYIDYEAYLKRHYDSYGYEVQTDEENKPIYPHEANKPTHETPEEKYEDTFGFESFIKNKYGLESTEGLEFSILLPYLKAYRAYLEQVTISKPETKPYVEERLQETEEIIEEINSNKLL